MKIEFLTGTNPDYPNDAIVRIYEFNCNESNAFKEVIADLIKTKNAIHFDTLSFIQEINCKFCLEIGKNDLGITRSGEDMFMCVLTEETYHTMLELLEPFCCENLLGYQWLYNLNTDIDFLYSPSGYW